jgi:hypothetical protein
VEIASFACVNSTANCSVETMSLPLLHAAEYASEILSVKCTLYTMSFRSLFVDFGVFVTVIVLRCKETEFSNVLVDGLSTYSLHF